MFLVKNKKIVSNIPQDLGRKDQSGTAGVGQVDVFPSAEEPGGWTEKGAMGKGR